MEGLPINPVDAAVAGVVLLAALLAFTRGFAAEVVSIATWVGSAAAALYALPYAVPIAQTYIKHEMLAYAAGGAAVFVVTLILLNVLGGQISNMVQRSRLSAVDRSLGFAFGVVKGLALVSIAYLFFAWLVPAPEHPTWLKEARSERIMRAGAAMILEALPAWVRDEAAKRTEILRDAAGTIQDLNRLSTPVPAQPKAADNADKGYGKSERGAINQLIQQNAAKP